MTPALPLTWDAPLLARAYQAWYAGTGRSASRLIDDALLDQGYQQCESLTAERSHTFHLASGLLPPAKRRAMRALYAFCRTTDDAVDSAMGDPADALLEWQRRALATQPDVDDSLVLAWADARERFGIPLGYAQQLIDGVGRDLRQTRYATFDELAAYAYGVASTVGLMSMHIIGFESEAAIPYAVRLGVALQLTNILRDVGEDWQAGRLYLPLAELQAFGISEVDVAAMRVDDHWRSFMRAQIDRTRGIYAAAWPGIHMLHPDGRFAVAAAGALYRAILDDIEAHDYDVFTRRAHVSRWGKLRRLPRIWWDAR